ncbi:uncharacterized protein LOC142336304 [Convolutriloba macropyga]|uniref:uncharacterized protein LOC142336304 n=1 Tax=Convolutriloba macropyga TaxID=536237 RepID=UPI003F51CE56
MESRDWDQLNDETFASDISDEGDNGPTGWETCHLDFVAQQQASRNAPAPVPQDHSYLKTSEQRQSDRRDDFLETTASSLFTSSANFANVYPTSTPQRVPQTSYSSSEPRPVTKRSRLLPAIHDHRSFADHTVQSVGDQSSQFQIEEDKYFEQNLAKSFDEMFLNENSDALLSNEDGDDITILNASSSTSRRQKNDSMSELFPDGFKFSPPLPPLNLAEFGVTESGGNIWNPEQQENDTDYINKHIKALLNIRPQEQRSGDQKQNNSRGQRRDSGTQSNDNSSSEPVKVYTLEELEGADVPKDAKVSLSPQEHSRMMPIGTPPRNETSNPPGVLNFAQFQQMMQQGMRGFHDNPQMMAAAAMNMQKQMALAAKMGITNPDALASFLRNNQQVPPGFMGPASPGNSSTSPGFQHHQSIHQQHSPRYQNQRYNQQMQRNPVQQMRNSVGAIPYPHPIPQGGRHLNAYQNRGNMQQQNRNFNNNNNNQRYQNRNQNREREKIVKGLMTEKEVEWIFKVQLMQLKMQDVQTEDFYYQQWKRKRSKVDVSSSYDQTNSPNRGNAQKGGRNEDLKTENRNQLNDRVAQQGETSNNLDARNVATNGSEHSTSKPESVPANPSPPLGNPDRSAQAAESSGNKSYEPTRFENTLGKISVGSIFQPRKLIDLDYITRDRAVTQDVMKNSSTSLRETRRHREHLLYVEKCLTIFDELKKQKVQTLNEDLDRSEKLKLEQNEQQQLGYVMKHFDFNNIDEIVKNMLLCGNKGCRFLGELLPRLSSDKQVLLMLSICTNLYPLIKKETASVSGNYETIGFRDPQFAIQLCKSFKASIADLESNIDKLEMLEILVSTANWKNSRFVVSLFVVLCSSIATEKAKDKFSFDRLVETLSGIESSLHAIKKSSTSITSNERDDDKYASRDPTRDHQMSKRAPFYELVDQNTIARLIKSVNVDSNLANLSEFLTL